LWSASRGGSADPAGGRRDKAVRFARSEAQGDFSMQATCRAPLGATPKLRPLDLSTRQKQLVDLVLDLGIGGTNEILKDHRPGVRQRSVKLRAPSVAFAARAALTRR
jgi:hypothetical protein